MLFPRDYYSKFDEIGEPNTDKDGLLHVELESITEEIKCQHCGGTNIKRIGFRKKEGFIDVTGEGAPVEITFRLQRYMCHDCTTRRAEETDAEAQKKIQTTFTTECLPDCIKKNKKISTDVVDTAISKVVRERISIADAAKSLHVSPGTVSQIISDQRTAALAMVKTLEAPDVLMAYFFNYGGKERCAILGTLGKRPMLYEILDNGQASSIRTYLTEKHFEDNYLPSVMLTDYPRAVHHKDLLTMYPDTPIGIFRESTFKKMKALHNQSWDIDTSNRINNIMLELGRILSAHFYDHQNDEFVQIDLTNEDIYEYLAEEEDSDPRFVAEEAFKKMFNAWWDSVDDEIKPRLQELHDNIEKNQSKILEGLFYTHRQYDPAVLLQCIEKLRSNHVPFKDLLSWLMLVVGVYNKEHVSALHMLSSSYVPQPIHGFYIDLNELNALLDA